jgi:type I restriction enzyme S subunit
MEKQKNIPKLRFPEFKGEWERKKLGEVATFSKGKGISKVDIIEDGRNECIRYGELYTHYNETINEIKSKTNIDLKDLVLSEANDVIIPASGETQIDIATASCVLKKGVALGGDLNIIKTKNDGVFLSYYLNYRKKYEIANLAQGISVVHLYSSQLSTLNLNLPSLPEQKRIASFFTVLDKKIAELKQKKALLEQYKKGVMQKLFSQELRFKNDNGKEFPKWEKKKLGEVAEFHKGKGLPKNEISENGKYECIHYGELFTKYKEKIENIISRTDVFDKPFLSIANDVLMPTSDVTPSGLATASCINKDGVILGGDVLIIRQSVRVLDGLFFSFYVGQHKEKVMKLVSGTTVYHLYGSDMKKLEIVIPSFDEQTKIAHFLSAIDEKIHRTESQIQQTQQYKKGLLQNMFI